MKLALKNQALGLAVFAVGALFFHYALGFGGMGPVGPSPGAVSASAIFTGATPTITVGAPGGNYGSVYAYDASSNLAVKLTGNSGLLLNSASYIYSGSSTTAGTGVDILFARGAAGRWDVTSDGSLYADLKLRSLTPVFQGGTELAPALTAGNWTVGSGWESPIVGPGLIKNADGTGTQTPSAATTIVAATTYKVVITLSAASVGSATYTIGGVAGASTLSAATTYTDYVTTTTTGKLIITPTNTSRFTISAISYKPVTGGIIGTTTNDLAPPGSVGEYKESLVAIGSAVTLTTSNTVYDITSLVLTAGDWDVSGNISLGNASGTITAQVAGLNTVTATIPTDGTEVNSGILTTAVSETDGITLPPKRILLAAGGTVYMSAKVTKAAGTITGWGSLRARRQR